MLLLLYSQKEMSNTYTITTAYDGEKPFHSFQFSDALAAFTVYLDIKDWGEAKEYATYNLSLPNGKMYTKHFYRS